MATTTSYRVVSRSSCVMTSMRASSLRPRGCLAVGGWGGLVEARHVLFFGDLVVGEIPVLAREPCADGVVAANDAPAYGAQLFVDAALVEVAWAGWGVLEMGVVVAWGRVVGVVVWRCVGQGGGWHK